MGSRNGGIQNFVAKRLGSLWVVQQYLKRLGVQETVDPACPVEGQAKLTHGQVLSVLVGNRLNSPAPLYQVGEWAKTYAAEEVFGTPATLLNDDRIGRALDAIYPHLETLKGSIGWRAITEFGIDTAVWHWDFTSLSFHGAFEDQDAEGPQVTYGHSKARRPDLKQVMVGFGVTGDGAIPLHHNTVNGSTAEVGQVVTGFQKLKELAKRDNLIMIGDIKLISQPNIIRGCRAGVQFCAPAPASDTFREVFLSIPAEGRRMAMTTFLLGLMAGAAVFLVCSSGSHPRRQTGLGRLYTKLGAAPHHTPSSISRVPWVRRLPPAPVVALIKPFLPARYQEKTRRLLRVSRLEETHTYDDIVAMKAAYALACWFYVALLMIKRPDPLLGVFLGSLGVLGFAAPDGWLRNRARHRHEAIQRELPSVLSAVAIALEAGLHLMSAIGEACRDRPGVLAAELRRAVEQYERGAPAVEALERVATELEVAEVTVALSTLIQAFAKGSSHVVKTVRSQAAEAWQKRRRRAEGLAQTASVRLFLPLALLALPGFLIFLLGPAVLEVIDYLSR